MKSKMAFEHEQVLKTLSESGLISKQAKKSIRGQILGLESFEDREAYLKRIIKNSAQRGKQWK